MNSNQITLLEKAFKLYIRRVAVSKRAEKWAERHRTSHPLDLAGYVERCAKPHKIILTAQGQFNTLCRVNISSKVMIKWDGIECCMVSHKPQKTMMVDMYVFGKPPREDSQTAMVLHNQEKAGRQAQHFARIRRTQGLQEQAAAELAALQVEYQQGQHKLKELRAGLSVSPKAHGLKHLSADDRPLHEEILALAKRLHMVKKAIPYKSRKTDSLAAKLKALVESWPE